MQKKQLLRRQRACGLFFLPALIWFCLALLSFPAFAVDDSMCARVKIEIKQELTLERQAFDAHMRINNGLSHITLQDVDVDVSFADEGGNPVLASSNPDDPDALFFIRLDSVENIDDVDGTGSVQPSSAADIHWLIIPATGASNGLEQGTLYYVGATLSYTIGGEEHVTEVTPDYIFVKPMPELTLDYFLPTDVYGDDAFTPEIEPPIPFSLGVRVKNSGAGVARDLSIASAQPKIVDNEQGLLVGFVIEGCNVNGQPAIPSLLADLGDIDPNASTVARWVMTCSLSGQFVEFTADYSHSDELGGELTSLLEATNTHFLVRDVLVDVAGRDSIRDFLAKDGDVYRVYESDSGTLDTEVPDVSASASLNGSGASYTLSVPVSAGFFYVKLPDPYSGQKEISEILRSDGKRIKPENGWLSKTRDANQEWEYFFNLFDSNTTGSYTVTFVEAAGPGSAPVLQFIPDQTVQEGEQLSFIVEATDTDGTSPSLSAAPLPALATFADLGDGTGTFDWISAEGQAGRYEITFTASDGVFEDSQRVTITVQCFADTDGDSMDDAWEQQHFGNLSQDGTGDFDGDGISDLDEFLNGTDPTSSNAPTIPLISAPADGAEVTLLQPDLVVQNSTDPDGDPIIYGFEIYSDQGMTTLVASQADVPEGVETTTWQVPQALQDNTWYYWRVKASDGIGFSEWAYGSLFVNTANDQPGAFQISNPQDNSEVDTVNPTLEVTNSTDVDEDVLTYAFKVYADELMSNVVASASGIEEAAEGATSWVVTSSLEDNTRYFWKAFAADEHGAETETALASFFVNTANDAPTAPVISSPAVGSEVSVQGSNLVVINGTDVDWDILSYVFELDQVNTFDSEAKQGSGEVSEGVDTTSWFITNLEDNTRYYWRVKATDGAASSPWVQGDFFVNTANDAPSTPTLKNPGESAWVDTLTPTLQVNASVDVDEDQITYYFEVYEDAALTQSVTAGQSETPEWVVLPGLSDNTWYYWRAMAEDEHGEVSEWMATASFFTDTNGVNDPPTIVLNEPSQDIVTDLESILISWEDADPETDADIALYYDTDNIGEDGTLIIDGLKEDLDPANDSYHWDITNVAEGTYYIYGTITDGNSSDASYAPGSVTIARLPTAQLVVPQPGIAVQDGVTFQATAGDDSGVGEVYFYLREEDGADGTPIGYEDLTATLNSVSGKWEYDVDTTLLPDGYYVFLAKAVDIYGNEGWSELVAFSIRNWAVVELLPASENNQPGRTMPVKFSVRIAYEVDAAQPFVYSEELEVRIYEYNPGTGSLIQLLQTSLYGDTSTDYRIDQIGELYISNFKTMNDPATYAVEVWRIRNGFLLDTFYFETTP